MLKKENGKVNKYTSNLLEVSNSQVCVPHTFP